MRGEAAEGPLGAVCAAGRRLSWCRAGLGALGADLTIKVVRAGLVHNMGGPLYRKNTLVYMMHTKSFII